MEACAASCPDGEATAPSPMRKQCPNEKSVRAKSEYRNPKFEEILSWLRAISRFGRGVVMSGKHRKNGLELPKFDPEESAAFAAKVLGDLKIKCVLIGGLAVWYWLPDPAGHAYTKDLDTAIKKSDRQKIINYLEKLKCEIRELVIGGINVHIDSNNINVDFIDRYSINEGDLSNLFEEAIDHAKEKIIIGESELYVISVEHLISMKISTFERKDEEDVKNLLEYDFVDIKKLREIVDRNVAPIRIKLEQILREVGHPMAHRRKKYY